ncbi:MAG: helix-turn-helix transcriptional regulator [Elusimicrobia bacterium]|nr:helix-turn-helix transcriptional regulator [Elusimicrobiota bacterium]
MDKLYKEIGSRIRSVRQALQKTQAEIAWSAGIETSFYGQIERGANIPSLKTLFAIAQALGVEAADLMPRRAGKKSSSTQALEHIVQGLDVKKKRLALGLVSDLVRRLRD